MYHAVVPSATGEDDALISNILIGNTLGPEPGTEMDKSYFSGFVSSHIACGRPPQGI